MKTLTAIWHLLLAFAILASPALGHYKTADVNDRAADWYFRGQTYRLDPANERADPVNFIFYGRAGANQATYTRANIEAHMQADWREGDVDGEGWRVDDRIIGLCKSEQFMYWRNFPGESRDQNDWHGSTARTRYCGNQHHARFWDDYEHDRDTRDHGPRHQWVVGGVHHERAPDHEIDRDWDIVRRELVEAMAEHCSGSTIRAPTASSRDRQLRVPRADLAASLPRRRMQRQ